MPEKHEIELEPAIIVESFDSVTAVIDFYNHSKPQKWFCRIPFTVPASKKPIKKIIITFEY